MSKNILYIVLTIIIALFILAGLAMKIDIPFEISQSYSFNVPAQKIVNQVTELKTSSQWDPWAMHEPTLNLKFSPIDKAENSWYEWDAKYIGAGRLTTTKIEKNTSKDFHTIEQSITFTKPMESKAQASWKIEGIEKSNKTRNPNEKTISNVTWDMKSTIPLLFAWSLPQLKQELLLNYKIGLIRLHHHLNPAAPKLSLSFLSIEEHQEMTGIAISYEGNLEGMGLAISVGYSKIEDWLTKQNINLKDAHYLSVYRKVNLKKDFFKIDIVINPHQDIPDKQLPEGMKKITLPNQKYFATQYTGTYDFMEYAWYSAFYHLKTRKYSFAWDKPSLESYISKTDVKTPKTMIYIPVK